MSGAKPTRALAVLALLLACAGLWHVASAKPATVKPSTDARINRIELSAEAIKAKRTLEGMGITPTSMEAILPSYLWRYRPAGQFTRKHPA